MDLSYTPEAEEFRTEIKSWLVENLPDGWFDEGFEMSDAERKEFNVEWPKRLFEGGWICATWPAEYGGKGLTTMQGVVLAEEFANAKAPMRGDFFGDTLVGPTLLQWGSEEQKARYFPRLSTDLLGAFALSEPASGSDAFALETRATPAPGGWALTGRKFWITNGAEAGFFVVFANTDFAKGYKGITGFLVERDFPGFSIGKKENKLGIRASSTVELILEDCQVPETNVLGPVGQGYKIAIETLNEGRIGIGAQMIGVATGALEAATTYVKERKQFGKSVAEFQGVQFQLAQMATELEAARLTVYNAARLKDSGRPFAREAAMAKLFSSQVADRTTSRCLELFGGYGYSKEYPAEKYYRDAKIGTIYEGTSNMQLQTIAKMMLR